MRVLARGGQREGGGQGGWVTARGRRGVRTATAVVAATGWRATAAST